MSTSSLKLNLRDKIDSISFKVLDDSNPDALFKGIDKMLYIDGRFYILDCMGTSSVLVFDDNGNFLFKVGDFGQGPGEYNSITDFDVNNGYIYILDSKKRMIFSFIIKFVSVSSTWSFEFNSTSIPNKKLPSSVTIKSFTPIILFK